LKTRVSPEKLKDAFGEPTQASNNWNVAIRFDTRGGELFADLTNLAGTGRSIGIFLDNQLISAQLVLNLPLWYCRWRCRDYWSLYGTRGK